MALYKHEEGKFRQEQHLTAGNPETVRVIHPDFTDRPSVIINKDVYDPKKHKLVNEFNQRIKENGMLLTEKELEAEQPKSAASAPAAGSKAGAAASA